MLKLIFMHFCNMKTSVYTQFSRFRQHLVIYLVNETATVRDVETETKVHASWPKSNTNQVWNEKRKNDILKQFGDA